MEKDGTNIKAINIARLWALTGCRRNEIAGLKWDEVDFENGMLVLEDSKTGQSMRPLGTAALTLLQQIERTEDSDFVFPADSGEGHFQGTKTLWARAIKKAGLPGVTPHTLRHTIGSTAIYAHIQHEPSRKAANRVSKKTAAALSPKAIPTGSLTLDDQQLLQTLKARLAKADTSARMLREAITALIEQGTPAQEANDAA